MCARTLSLCFSLSLCQLLCLSHSHIGKQVIRADRHYKEYRQEKVLEEYIKLKLNNRMTSNCFIKCEKLFSTKSSARV